MKRRSPVAGADPVAVGLRLLARRGRSAAEIEQELYQHGFAVHAVRAGLARLRELGYVDDRRLAADRSELLQNRGHGSERIRSDLEGRGINPEVVFGVLPGPEKERLTARRVLNAKGARYLGSPKERARGARFLVQRGFSMETVEWAIGTWDDGN